MMLILIGIVPGYFALNANLSPKDIGEPLRKIELIMNNIDPSQLSTLDRNKFDETKQMQARLLTGASTVSNVASIAKAERFNVRKDIMVMSRNIKDLLAKPEIRLSESERAEMDKSIKSVRKLTDYSPKWVILMISLSLGTGTMIGWKRIVKTVGEKIGKEHLTYAQGASAELVTASTIGLSSSFGLPVSTTHVLSSGIAGSMVANKGIKNLQASTVRNILMAWFLTLPVVMVLSGTLFLLFRAIF
jgi:PiT family inorganic phosphate transporter